MEAGSWQVGDVRISRVVESEVRMPPRGLMGEATAEAMAAHAGWLKPHFLDDDGQVTLCIQALVVESGDLRVLVDTCVGDRDVPGFDAFSNDVNPFLERLEAAGHSPADIDIVLCTHLHFDHVGWNTMKVGDAWVPTFPNARYLFARAEWEHWSEEPDSPFVGSLDECVRPVIDAGLADLVDVDHRIDERVSLQPTPGHTPGHVSVRIESGGALAFITGDMTHHPVQWAEPDWKMMADSDAAEASATRKRVAAELISSGSLVIGTHYASPTAGWLEEGPGGVRFVTRRSGDASTNDADGERT
jgi:glyoxylase-like metal-dependent hydrolase (beta-lactamase superfamily II)